MGRVEVDSGNNNIAGSFRGLVISIFHLECAGAVSIMSWPPLETGGRQIYPYLADSDGITQRLQLGLESSEFLRIGITDVPAEQRLGAERDRMDDIFGERVLGEDLEEVVFAGAPHGLLLRVITVPDDSKNSPVARAVSISVS